MSPRNEGAFQFLKDLIFRRILVFYYSIKTIYLLSIQFVVLAISTSLFTSFKKCFQ